MRNRFTIILFIGLLSIFSCKVEETEETTKSNQEIIYEKGKIIDSINTSQTSNLIHKYNSFIISKDSLNYTYELQEIVKTNEGPLAIIGYVNDIIQKESHYILKVSGSIGRKNFIGHFITSAELFLKIKSEIGPNFPQRTCLFIVQSESITSSSILEIDIDKFVDDISDAELIYNFNNSKLFVKGNLVDFYFFEAKTVFEGVQY